MACNPNVSHAASSSTRHRLVTLRMIPRSHEHASHPCLASAISSCRKRPCRHGSSPQRVDIPNTCETISHRPASTARTLSALSGDPGFHAPHRFIELQSNLVVHPDVQIDKPGIFCIALLLEDLRQLPCMAHASKCGRHGKRCDVCVPR